MSAKIGLLEHFRKLATFRGREDRGSFWPYAALVFGILTVAGSLMMMPMMFRTMRAVENFNVQDSDPGPILNSYGFDDGPPTVPTDLAAVMPSAQFLWAYLGVTFGLAITLYAAAVTRRLHDRGKSGAWGLMPLPFALYTSIQMPRMFESFGRGPQPDMALFGSLFVSNLCYWIALVALVVLLAGAGDPEANRYDPGD